MHVLVHLSQKYMRWMNRQKDGFFCFDRAHCQCALPVYSRAAQKSSSSKLSSNSTRARVILTRANLTRANMTRAILAR
jgi:hypothetical protein